MEKGKQKAVEPEPEPVDEGDPAQVIPELADAVNEARPSELGRNSARDLPLRRWNEFAGPCGQFPEPAHARDQSQSVSGTSMAQCLKKRFSRTFGGEQNQVEQENAAGPSTSRPLKNRFPKVRLSNPIRHPQILRPGRRDDSNRNSVKLYRIHSKRIRRPHPSPRPESHPSSSARTATQIPCRTGR